LDERFTKQITNFYTFH